MQIDLFDTNMKYCCRCKQKKAKTKFCKDKSRKDGLANACRRCCKEYREANKAILRKKRKEYYEANKASVREYYEANKDKILEYRKEYYETNKDKIREYYEANKHLHNARQAKRRAAKLEATPDWLTEEQLNQIKDLYWLAQDLKAITGEDYHVDHIIPLQGKEVRGLHVPWNLQILPADINLSKGNRLEDGSTEA